MQRDSLGSSPCPLCWPEGLYSRSTTGVEVESVLPRSCYPKSGMSDPSRSAILLIWECLGEMPGSPGLSPISVPSLDTEGPLMLPRSPVPRALAVLRGWSEGEEMPLSHLSSLQHLPCALTHPSSWIPFSQTAKHLRLLAPPSLLHQWSPQAQLSRSPKRWRAVWGAWPQIHPGGSEPV